MTYHVEITAKALREIDEALEWHAILSFRTAVTWTQPGNEYGNPLAG
jgi:hypothetical protein